MGVKKFFRLFFVFVVAVGMLSITATAETVHDNYSVRLEDMDRVLVDMTKMEMLDETMVRATGSINSDVPANKTAVSGKKFPLEVGETVTINCSYSPASASVDFGVIAPDGYFYFLNVKGGSINQSMMVSQRGDYSMAIRNNSSSVVKVVGFVNY